MEVAYSGEPLRVYDNVLDLIGAVNVGTFIAMPGVRSDEQSGADDTEFVPPSLCLAHVDFLSSSPHSQSVQRISPDGRFTVLEQATSDEQGLSRQDVLIYRLPWYATGEN